MKKILFCVFLVFFAVHPAWAKTDVLSDTTLSTSDLVYADIALHGYLDNMSVSFEDGNAGDSIAINSFRQWLPASTVKLYVAMYAFKRIEEGSLRLTDLTTVSDVNIVPTEMDSSDLPLLQPGETVSISRLLRQMIMQSDNTAYNQLLDILDRQKISQYINDLGITHTHIGSKLNQDATQGQSEYDIPGYGINTTTADDYTKAFLKIKYNQVPGATVLFGILKQQRINDMIPALLPKDVTVAHKTGDLAPLYHDGGIVEGPHGSYVLSIFTNVGDPSVIAHESELIYTNDYNLVGEDTPIPTPTGVSANPPIDPLVFAEQAAGSHVLGDTNIPFVQVPEITAADLGINARDLSLTIPSHSIPNVLISADSPFHPIIPFLDFFAHMFTGGQAAKTQVDIGILLQKEAEARDLVIRGKRQEAEALIAGIQPQLSEISQRTTIPNDTEMQTAIQSLSETRFSLLADMLKHTNGIEKRQLVKLIAQQARETVVHVLPQLPKSQNATNPSQKPVIAKVVSSSANSVTIQTSGGSTVTVPLSSSIKIRAKESELFASGPQKLKAGTTIAMMGSYVTNTFTPSFILTDVPRQLVAPQPERVVKVDVAHNRFIVSSNGVLLQVNILPKTVIKGGDTVIPLKAIKPGDIVVVHGVPVIQQSQLTPPISTPTPTLTIVPMLSVTPTGIIKGQNQPTPTFAIVPSINSSIKGKNHPTPTLTIVPMLSVTPTGIIKGQINKIDSQNTLPTSIPQQIQQVKSNNPPTVQHIEIIQSTSVQVIEKNKDVPTPQPKPETPQKKESSPLPPKVDPTKKP